MTHTHSNEAMSNDGLGTFAIGDGVSWGAGTDVEAGTVVSVTGKSVTVSVDQAVLQNGAMSGAADALRVSVGGFCAHVQGVQRYTFETVTENPHLVRFTWRDKMGAYKQAGTSSSGSMRGWGLLSHGRDKHFDSNF